MRMRRKSSIRGDFFYEREGNGEGWIVSRRTGPTSGLFRGIGIARSVGRRRWDGYRAGVMVCPDYRSREQVAYCLNRKQEEER